MLSISRFFYGHCYGSARIENDWKFLEDTKVAITIVRFLTHGKCLVGFRKRRFQHADPGILVNWRTLLMKNGLRFPSNAAMSLCLVLHHDCKSSQHKKDALLSTEDACHQMYFSCSCLICLLHTAAVCTFCQ